MTVIRVHGSIAAVTGVDPEADLHSKILNARLPRVQILSISSSFFWKFWQNRILAPMGGLVPPPRRNPESDHLLRKRLLSDRVTYSTHCYIARTARGESCNVDTTSQTSKALLIFTDPVDPSDPFFEIFSTDLD